ncbi:hypothetical protein EXIGLDRAFT_777293 [Exidia glandulosa HHB12029]|uniref:Uncharacterized protein n=1 Tax=Exidia glandulosa HHB12029 TaxID=1314781 RepID=A0A165D3B2_EXIGL|nr:hypothetical protein EXIGLDRAFT_777293 [Exidia glandulosa HHB12029]
MSSQQAPKSVNSSRSDLDGSEGHTTVDRKFGGDKPHDFPRLGKHDFLEEDRFGELDRHDSIPAESRDLGHIGPIVREVGDKVKDAAHKVGDKLACGPCAGDSVQKRLD